MYRYIHYTYISALVVLLPLFQLTEQNIQEKEERLELMQDDTSRVNLLVDLGKYYCSRNFEISLLYLQQAFLLSTELNYKEGIASSLLWQGRAYYYKDDYMLALEYLEKARKLFDKLNHQQGLAWCCFASGSIHHINGNYLAATRDFQEVVRLSKQAEDIELEATGYLSLGSLHIDRDEPFLALDYLNKALKINEKIRKQSEIGIILTNIGRAYELVDDIDLALDYFEQGLEIRTGLKEQRGIASSNLIIGKIMLKTGDFQDANNRFETAHSLFTQLKDDTGIGLSLLNWAIALNKLNKIEEAYSKAQDALHIARNINNPKLLAETYTALASINAYNKRFEEAFKYKTMDGIIRDSLATANRERIIRELEIKFQTARKDDEINFLKTRNEIQAKNNFLLTVSILALIVIAILLIVLFHFKTISMKKHKLLMEQEKTIHQQQSNIRQKEQQLLEKKLEAKNRELASKALDMLRMNETISNIIEKLEQFVNTAEVDEKHVKHINEIVAGLEAKLKDNSWSEFEKIFKNIHTAFFQKLLDVCPDLTPAEIKIAAFLKLNLSTKEIAAVTFKSESGVKSTRFRLRSKLGLQSDESLVAYLIRI